jgi:hypothetical protein
LNKVKNPEFKNKLANWKFREFKGKSKVVTGKLDDRSSVCFSIVKPGVISAANKYAANAQLAQDCYGLEIGKKYKVVVTFRTSEDYKGSV